MWPADEIEANNIRLRYYRTGGDKPPVVLAHGFSDNGLCWTAVAQALAADYDLIMYDARGHGFSGGPEAGYADDYHAEDLAALIKALRLDKPTVVGHSMGARTAAMTAARYPGLLRAIVLEDPPWSAEWATRADVERFLQAQADNTLPPAEHPFRDWLLDLRRFDRDQLIARCRADNPHWPEAEYAPWADSKLQFNLDVFNVLDRDQPLSPPWRETVEAIACPALLLTGEVERGGIITPELAAQAAALNPRLRTAHISGAGHNIRRDQPAHYLEIVRRFLSEQHSA